MIANENDRNIFVGAHVTSAVKYTLRRLVLERRMSMSAFIADAIREKLERAGAELQEPPAPRQAA